MRMAGRCSNCGRRRSRPAAPTTSPSRWCAPAPREGAGLACSARPSCPAGAGPARPAGRGGCFPALARFGGAWPGNGGLMSAHATAGPRQRVVIAGGGFAGFHAARRLGRLAGNSLEVVVVNPTDYFLYLPLLPEVAAGILDPRTVAAPLAATGRRGESSQGAGARQWTTGGRQWRQRPW